jgi:hypothetical protein
MHFLVKDKKGGLINKHENGVLSFVVLAFKSEVCRKRDRDVQRIQMYHRNPCCCFFHSLSQFAKTMKKFKVSFHCLEIYSSNTTVNNLFRL